MCILAISDSILRGITARNAVYRRYRKKGKGYQRIRGNPQVLLHMSLIQLIFGGWSPSSEGLTDEQKRNIQNAVTSVNETITHILLVTGINSIRRKLFSAEACSEAKRAKRINQTAEAIYRVIRDLKLMFPNTKISYLGCSRLLTKSNMPPRMKVDERLRDYNQDLDSLMGKLKKEFTQWKEQTYNPNKRGNKDKHCPEIFNVFSEVNDTHIWDLWGHLSPAGDILVAKAIQDYVDRSY